MLFPAMRRCHISKYSVLEVEWASDVARSANREKARIVQPFHAAKISRLRTVALSLPAHSSFFFDDNPPVDYPLFRETWCSSLVFL